MPYDTSSVPFLQKQDFWLLLWKIRRGEGWLTYNCTVVAWALKSININQAQSFFKSITFWNVAQISVAVNLHERGVPAARNADKKGDLEMFVCGKLLLSLLLPLQRKNTK